MRTIADEARSSQPPAATQGQRVHAPRLRWALVGLIGMVAFWGSVGGWSFITDPTGAGLRARLAWLERTPVDDFLIPGWYLFLAYGVGGLLVIVGLLRRTSPGPLRRLDAWIGFRWPWAGALTYGVVLVLWIAYELVVMPERIWIQPALVVVGALISTIPLARSMRRWYAVQGSTTERG